MICIKSIEVVILERDTLEIFLKNDEPWLFEQAGGGIATIDEPVRFATEMIHGERFTNGRGETVCIGMSKQVQEAIGLPMKAFSNMRNHLEQSRRETQRERNRANELALALDEFDRMTLWQRIKFLF